MKYEVKEDKTERDHIPQLDCHHDEADTRLLWHMKNMTETHPNGKLAVRSSDTDVFVLLMTHANNIPAHLWLDTGLAASNTRRYIDISRLAANMGPELCTAIAGLHAFTGCDYTASFLRKGKVRPLVLAEKTQTFLNFLES